MIVGVPKEIKTEEYRVGMIPAGVAELVRSGHRVLVEMSAGLGSNFRDEEYLAAGAEIVSKENLFERADLIVKVKEPLSSEYSLFREGLALFTYLHLAPNKPLIAMLLERKVTGLAYETLVQDGALPLLAPMSEIAGRMAPLMGSYYLQKKCGGTGVLPTGATGVSPAKAVVLGAGVVGTNAVSLCVGLGMETVVMNRGTDRLKELENVFSGRIRTCPLDDGAIRREIRDTDMVIGAVLVPGGRTPVLIDRDMLKTMKRGAVIVDVSIDQGGCVETAHPTTHTDPVYVVDGILHYCVANMPGAYPRTSTIALTAATLPYITMLAQGIPEALERHPVFRSALNTFDGNIVHETLAKM